MKLRSVMTVLALAAAMPCFAAEDLLVNITKFKYGGEKTTDIYHDATKKATGVPAGEFVGWLGNNSFSTFCTDVYQSFYWNQSSAYSLHSVEETVGRWDADPYAKGSYAQVSKLFSAHYNDVVDGLTSSAFQFALWEVLYEDKSTYDVSSGAFYLSGGTGGDAQVGGTARNIANSWLASLATASADYEVRSLSSTGKQDFLVATPVPEPQTYALALVSLGIVAGYARRKRDKA